MVEGDPNKPSAASQVEEDIAALSAFLKPRLEQARRGDLSKKTFEEIREGAKQRLNSFGRH